MTETHEPTVFTHDDQVHALTAFMVVVDETGKAYAILEPPAGVAVEHLPDMTSIRRACSEIVDDINAQSAGQYAAAITLSALEEARKREAPSEGVRKAFKKRKEPMGDIPTKKQYR
jgi:hypothetical protein